MRARLIGERSAGMTAVEIYDGQDMVWAHQYFQNGATYNGYVAGLCQVYDDMAACANVADYDGGEYDEDGAPVSMDDAPTTGVIVEYDSDSGVWAVGPDARRMGQSEEVLDACMLVGLIPADSDHDDRADDEVVRKIAGHIRSRLYA